MVVGLGDSWPVSLMPVFVFLRELEKLLFRYGVQKNFEKKNFEFFEIWCQFNVLIFIYKKRIRYEKDKKVN